MSAKKKRLPFILVSALIAAAIIVQCFFPIARKSTENNTKNGFQLVKQTYICSLKTTVMQYVHVKSGAKLIYLKNSDPNKSFCINFRTPPSDNSGVNHIIEHCILDGSKNYPVNNAAIMMNNQSLCSAENGHTDEESTEYFVTSSNDKDFTNFTGLLLDCVFHPSFLTNQNIFLQEGGHYEFNADKSKAEYTGVVYNEQKTAVSNADIMDFKFDESVLPDTIYKWNSGGNPQNIPDVTYDKVKDVYNKYYKASNSYIYLYGDLNIDEMLKYIDNNYLSKFNNEKVDSEISLQQHFEKNIDKTYRYDVNSNTGDKNSTCLSENYVIDNVTNADVVNAFAILCDILPDKLNEVASAEGLSGLETGLYCSRQPVFTIEADNINASQKAAFEKVIDDTLKDIVTKGIDKNTVKSLITSYESIKNNDMLSKDLGIQLNDNIMQSWLFGGDPTLYLDEDKYISALKKELSGNYFEDMIKKYLINNNHKSIVTYVTRMGALKKTDSISTSNMSQSQIDKINTETESLKKWQKEASSNNAISKLPLLTSDDLKINKPQVNSMKLSDGTSLLYTPVNTVSGSYYNLYFDTSMIPQDKIPYINLLCYILSNGSGNQYKKYASADGTNNPTYGNITFSSDAYGKFNSSNVFSPKIKAYVAATDGNIDKSLKLLKKIVTDSDLSNKEQIKNLIIEAKNASKSHVSYCRFLGYLSDDGKYNDHLKGYPYYNFLCNLQDNFDLKWGEIQNNLSDIYHTVFNKNNLVVGFVGTSSNYNNFRKSLPGFLDGIKVLKSTPATYSFNDQNKNEAIPLLSPNINEVVKGYNFKVLGYKYNGSMNVLQTVLSDYLINQARACGGYGAYSKISENGNIYFSNSRMPDTNKSMLIFNSLPTYLADFKADNNEMMRYKIGAIKSLANSGPQVHTAISTQEDEIMGKKPSDYEKEEKEILNTSQTDISKMSDMIQKVINQNVFLIQGNKNMIDDQKSTFSKIIHLTK